MADLRRQNAELKNALQRGNTERSIKPPRRAKSRASPVPTKRRNSIGAASSTELKQIAKEKSSMSMKRTNTEKSMKSTTSKLPKAVNSLTPGSQRQPKAVKKLATAPRRSSLSNLQTSLSRSATERSLKSNASNSSLTRQKARNRPKTAAAADPFEKYCKVW